MNLPGNIPYKKSRTPNLLLVSPEVTFKVDGKYWWEEQSPWFYHPYDLANPYFKMRTGMQNYCKFDATSSTVDFFWTSLTKIDNPDYPFPGWYGFGFLPNLVVLDAWLQNVPSGIENISFQFVSHYNNAMWDPARNPQSGISITLKIYRHVLRTVDPGNGAPATNTWILSDSLTKAKTFSNSDNPYVVYNADPVNSPFGEKKEWGDWLPSVVVQKGDSSTPWVITRYYYTGSIYPPFQVTPGPPYPPDPEPGGAWHKAVVSVSGPRP